MMHGGGQIRKARSGKHRRRQMELNPTRAREFTYKEMPGCVHSQMVMITTCHSYFYHSYPAMVLWGRRLYLAPALLEIGEISSANYSVRSHVCQLHRIALCLCQYRCGQISIHHWGGYNMVSPCGFQFCLLDGHRSRLI